MGRAKKLTTTPLPTCFPYARARPPETFPMPYETWPAFIRGLYFPDGETHHRFLTDMDAGLCDPDELETWLCWPRSPEPAAPSAPPPATPSTLESISDAAKRTNVSKKRIRSLVKTRQVRCVRHSKARNSHINVVRASLDEWIDEQSR